MTVKRSIVSCILFLLLSALAWAIDSDNDGLTDDVEAGLGSSAYHKDVFVEIDWLIVNGRNLKPRPGFLTIVTAVFNAAPVQNPDGTTGIRLHVQLSNGIVTPTPVLGTRNPDGSYNWSAFDAIKSRNFNSSKLATYHYCLFVRDIADYDSQGNLTQTSGLSRNSNTAFTAGASDFIVALGGTAWWNKPTMAEFKWSQAGTFLHELGHNLGKRHGGGDHVSFKPNHLSVMSYCYQLDGIPVTATDGNRYYLYDYGRFTPAPLNENNLNEFNALGPRTIFGGYHYGAIWWLNINGVLRAFEDFDASYNVDWNQDGSIRSGVRTDLNPLYPYVIVNGFLQYRPFATLKPGVNEWLTLAYSGGSIGKPGRIAAAPFMPESTTLRCLSANDYPAVRKPRANVPNVTFGDLK